MASIRSRGNRATELRLIALLRAHRITGWRRGVPLPGRPDFVFRAARLAVFVDGCFWHGCPRHGRVPTSRLDYWAPKLARNAQRDREVTRTLRAAGWTVLRIWECGLARKRASRTMLRLGRALGIEGILQSSGAPRGVRLRPEMAKGGPEGAKGPPTVAKWSPTVARKGPTVTK